MAGSIYPQDFFTTRRVRRVTQKIIWQGMREDQVFALDVDSMNAPRNPKGAEEYNRAYLTWIEEGERLPRQNRVMIYDPLLMTLYLENIQ